MSTGLIENTVLKKSRFLIPYRKEKGNFQDKDLNKWEQMIIKSKYLTDNIKMLFDKNSNVSRIYRWKLLEQYGVLSINISYKRSSEAQEMTFDFKLSDIFEIQFITGINILVIEITYDDDEKLTNIANIGFLLSHLDINRNGSEGDSFVETSELPFIAKAEFSQFNDETKERIIFSQIIRNIIMDDKTEEDIEISGRILAYHNLVVDKKCTKDDCILFFLRRCREYIVSKDYECDYEAEKGCVGKTHCQCAYEEKIEFKYDNSQNIVWSGCANGVVSLATRNEFVENKHIKNVDNDYFLLFLYTLHERETLLRYSSEIVSGHNEEKYMKNLRNKLMDFNAWFGFNVVSHEMAYQKIYEELHKAFRLDILEKEVQEVLIKVTDFLEKKRKSRTGKILWFISVTSVVSATKTIVDFIEKFTGKDAIWQTAFGVGFVGLCLLIGIIRYWKD